MAVGSTGGIKPIESQFVEFGQMALLSGAVDLVDRKKNRFRGPAEQLNEIRILRVQTRLGIRHEQDDIGFIESQQDLFARQGFQPGTLRGHVATRIHKGKGSSLPAYPGVVAIPGDPGKVSHQSLVGSTHAVEKRGLAHIGPTHYGYDCHGTLDSWSIVILPCIPWPPPSRGKGRQSVLIMTLNSPPGSLCCSRPTRPSGKRPPRCPSEATG